MEKIPETAADISPYATSDFQTMPLNSGMGRNTIGRKETMRMTDYQQHQLSQPDMGSMGTVGTLGTGGMVNTVGRHRVGVFFIYINKVVGCLFVCQHRFPTISFSFAL